MVLRSVWFYLLGYVIIKVKGRRLEDLLNRASRAGISLWNTRQIAPGFLVASISIVGFRQIRPLVRDLGLEIRIVERAGLPFVLKQALGRPGFLLGLGVCMAAVYVLSTFVWFVDVSGVEKISPEVVLKTAAEAGLKPGVAKKSVDADQITDYLMNHIPHLAWVGVDLKGTMVSIRLVEKVVVDKESVAPGDVVAGKSGLIQQIVPFVGAALVKEGDTVVAGQLLITGKPHGYDQEGKLYFLQNGLYQRADGIVKARVWYEAEVEVPLYQVEETPTGKSSRYYTIHVGKHEMQLGNRQPRYEHWRQESEEKTLRWRNVSIPIEVVEHRFVEVNRREYTLAMDDAVQLGVEKAKEALTAQIPKDTKVSFRPPEVSRLDSSEGELARVTLVAETTENIAQLSYKNTNGIEP